MLSTVRNGTQSLAMGGRSREKPWYIDSQQLEAGLKEFMRLHRESGAAIENNKQLLLKAERLNGLLFSANPIKGGLDLELSLFKDGVYDLLLDIIMHDDFFRQPLV